MKKVITFVRILAGAVFIFSGIVKGVDPAGSAIKFGEYLEAFHLDFLHFLVLPMAFLLPLLEFLIGISLLFNIHVRWGERGFLWFMLFFTPLTLILALFNPVSDCGCFGDAVVLTNWQTFGKNVALLAMAFFLHHRRHLLQPTRPPATDHLLTGAYALFFLFLAWYSYVHLPLFDFRPYKIGANIPQEMTIPEDAPHDVYETTLIYEKDGVQKEFTMDNFPWQDTTWKFVDQRTVLVKRGYIPPIHDFSIVMPDGTDITDMVLSSKDPVFLLISPDFSEASEAGLNRAVRLFEALEKKGIAMYVVTASPEESAVERFGSHYPVPWTGMDETTCKTVIRSNPGLVLVKEGTILAKWHHRDIPGPSLASEDLLSFSVSRLRKQNEVRLASFLITLMLLIITVAPRRGILHSRKIS